MKAARLLHELFFKFFMHIFKKQAYLLYPEPCYITVHKLVQFNRKWQKCLHATRFLKNPLQNVQRIHHYIKRRISMRNFLYPNFKIVTNHIPHIMHYEQTHFLRKALYKAQSLVQGPKP